MAGTASESEMQAKFAAVRKWQFRSRVITILTVVIVAAEFGIFYFQTYHPIRDSFKEEGRLQKALQESVPKASENIAPMLRRVADETLPIYQREARSQYEKLRESLGISARERLQKLPEDGGKLMSEKLNLAMDGAIKQLEPEVVAAFPSLTDATKRDLLIHDFLTAAEDKNKVLAAKINKIQVDEMTRVKSVMDKFALPPDEMAGKDEEMGKELVRTMLLLAQAHLDEMDEAEGKKKDVVPVKFPAEASPTPAKSSAAPSTAPSGH